VTSESAAINSRRASGSIRPPDYVVVVSASDWVMEHSRRAGPTCGTPYTPAKTTAATPSSAWE
jgi:hypothetical protein